MNIGIVTWYNSRNYGTNLQAYALIYKLRSLGLKSFIVEPFDLSHNSLKSIIKLFLDKIGILKYIKRRHFLDKQGINLYRFFQNEIPTVEVLSTKQYETLLKRFPIFITGSDQIWNPYYVNEFQLLAFAKNKKKISYASSIGTTSIPKTQEDFYRKYLRTFQHISLREETGSNIIRQLLPEQDIRTVLDPTFLLDSNEWTKFGNKGKLQSNIPDKYILVYLIGNNDYYPKYIEKLRSQIGNIPIVIVKSIENKEFYMDGAIICQYAGPYEFIKLILKSTIVCTDSFHACALSLNLSKQFVVLKRFNDQNNQSQNSRLYDILQHFNLSDRIMETLDFKFNSISYKEIQRQISQERNQCISYLLDCVKL